MLSGYSRAVPPLPRQRLLFIPLPMAVVTNTDGVSNWPNQARKHRRNLPMYHAVGPAHSCSQRSP